MFNQTETDSLKTAIGTAKSIIIALPPEPDMDTVAAGLGLYYSLVQTKSVHIGSSQSVKISNARLLGIEKIETNIGNQNLVISFDYPEDKLDKVDYERSENGNVKLLIKPRAGETAPDPSLIKFNYSGAEADLVFVLGIQTLEELGRLYSEEKAFFDSANIVSLNLTQDQSNFAKHSFHTQSASCLSELVAYLLRETEYSTTPDGATDLLLSISQASDNYTSQKITPDTFEITAFLLRQGGRRSPALFRPAFVPQSVQAPLPVASMAPKNQTENRVPSDWKQPKIFRNQPPSTK